MKSSDIDQELFTESYCKVCSAQLISESQRVAHYESRKHASKVRLYYMLHPIDGGCPAKKLRSENGSDGDTVDKNKCCTLCNMSFTSAVVAESHYQGKIHAKRLKLLLGEPPALKSAETALSSLKQPHTDRPPVVSSPHQRRDSDRYCQLCAAWFNNPMMAQQHYDGKKHKKNAARADLLEQLGKTLDLGELRGLKRSYTCNICNVTLNSIEQYHAHLKGSKHQTNSTHQSQGTRSQPQEFARLLLSALAQPPCLAMPARCHQIQAESFLFDLPEGPDYPSLEKGDGSAVSSCQTAHCLLPRDGLAGNPAGGLGCGAAWVTAAAQPRSDSTRHTSRVSSAPFVGAVTAAEPQCEVAGRMRAFVLRWLLGTAVPPHRAWSHAGSNPELHAGIWYL
uniref:Zinc finger matrin-type 4 n=1 Tax=Cairina moschata TaxID=8855 RepID=A0A8C3BKM2_CAIMO